VLGSLKSEVRLVLALHTLETKHDLLRGLSLLVEHWLGLATISLLLTVVTALSLCVQGSLASLVLCDFVDCVLLAVFGCAEGLLHLGDGHLPGIRVMS